MYVFPFLGCFREWFLCAYLNTRMVFMSSCPACNISYCFVACSSVLCRSSGWLRNSHHVFIGYQNQISGLFYCTPEKGKYMSMCYSQRCQIYILRKLQQRYLFQDPEFHRKINWDRTEFGEGMNLLYSDLLFKNNRDKIHRRVTLLVFCVGFDLGRSVKLVGVLTMLK
jgi:hypothetical protein